MILWHPVGVLVLHALTEMDICSLDSVSIDRVLG
jgi:hypothetical protein